MFRFIVTLGFLYISICSYAIDFKVGIMGGANSSFNQLYTFGDIKKADPKLGYNANIFARFKFSGYIIQPEAGYLMNRVGFSISENGSTREANFGLGQFYAAALMGYKLSKLRFSAGPMISFTASQSFDALTSQSTLIQQINDGRVNIGAMIDVGLDVSKRWSIDLRASRTFTQSEFNTLTQNNTFNFSGNTGVISIMIGYTIFKTP
ncbi:MAG: outer membrane beta-barrel protein [Chitinophagales bacterium]|nr:outer membrane beta-barrel protein [Chitinophagales bacterium]